MPPAAARRLLPADVQAPSLSATHETSVPATSALTRFRSRRSAVFGVGQVGACRRSVDFHDEVLTHPFEVMESQWPALIKDSEGSVGAPRRRTVLVVLQSAAASNRNRRVPIPTIRMPQDRLDRKASGLL